MSPHERQTPDRSAIFRRHNYAAAVASEWIAPALRLVAHTRSGPATPPSTWRHLAIFGASHVGDVMYRTASLPALRHALPNCRISYICEPLTAEILATDPNVDDVLPIVRPGWRTARATRATLATVDAALSTNHIAYHADLATAVWLGIPNRIAFAHKGFSGLMTCPIPAGYPQPFPAYPRAMIATLACVPPTWPLTPRLVLTGDDHAAAATVWATLGLAPDHRVIACTLTNRQPWSRTLPATTALRALASLHARLGLRIVLCGSATDAPVLRRAADAAGFPCLVMAGQLALRPFAAFLARCDALLATDSGPRHLANAVGTPVVFARSVNVSRIENGVYCDNETDLCGPEEWLRDPDAQDAVLARITPESVADTLERVVTTRRAAA
jgi:ADP-heptose:LPS heptosyltransferase